MFEFQIKTKEDLEDLREELKSVSKNETIEDHERHVKILNTKQNVIAVEMKTIRQFAHKIFKSGYEKFLDLSLSNDLYMYIAITNFIIFCSSLVGSTLNTAFNIFKVNFSHSFIIATIQTFYLNLLVHLFLF